jgi:hypothetical protein
MLVVAGLMLGSHLSAQDLEPRSLSPAPVGMSFALLGYGYSIGNIVLDQALPLEGTEARVHTVSAAYARSIDLFGLSGRVTAVVPLATSTWSGEVSGVDADTTRNGLGDPLVAFAVNFVGAPALRTTEYAAYRPRTLVGASLKVRVPLGQYDRTKFFNLGTNRWTVSPRLGVARYLGRLTLEGYVSGWFFTTNGDFFNGSTVAQAPMVALQLHASYAFRRGLWGAVSFGQNFGGSLTVDGVDTDNAQSNNRLGATLAIPLSTAHALKLAFASGISTRAGADFDTFIVAWQYRWGG